MSLSPQGLGRFFSQKMTESQLSAILLFADQIACCQTPNQTA
jgi:hypothetical protein